MEAWAVKLATVNRAEGVVGFTKMLIGAIRQVVDGFSPTGASMDRVAALVWRLAAGQIHDVTTPGAGRQFAPSYLEGLLPSAPFHAPAAHPWLAPLARRAGAIQREMHAQAVEGLWAPASKAACQKMFAPEWRIVSLVTSGIWVQGGRFPETRAALESASSQGLRAFEVLLARMPARTSIGSHSDNMNYVLTAHVGLELEEGSCELTVGEHAHGWREGEALVFDTSYMHSAVNRSGRDRYVLVIRFWHPSVSEEERFAFLFLQQVMAQMKAHGQAEVLFQAKHETHGPHAAGPGGPPR
uniref:Aspartyl/asparaginy/proline hydroxylase domain-containing protein n=1 Tax=Zooxanthella nutricula TaxID=1333877 RepID=A0A7S2K737_9DINO